MQSTSLGKVILIIYSLDNIVSRRSSLQQQTGFKTMEMFTLFPICRLSTQHTALTKVEAEQQEFIEQFILQK